MNLLSVRTKLLNTLWGTMCALRQMIQCYRELTDRDASQQLWFVPTVDRDGEKMFNPP